MIDGIIQRKYGVRTEGVSGNFIFYSDGARRGEGEAASAWVGRRFWQNEAGHWESEIMVRDGLRLEDNSVSAFGAELIAIDGAVESAFKLVQ